MKGREERGEIERETVKGREERGEIERVTVKGGTGNWEGKRKGNIFTSATLSFFTIEHLLLSILFLSL